MKILLLMFFISAFSLKVEAQKKYLIYFADKGIRKSEFSSSSKKLFKLASNELSTKAVLRREKVMGSNYITFQDLPIRQLYISTIEALGVKIKNELRWFNAVSAYLTSEQLSLVQLFSFVKEITPVKVFTVPQSFTPNTILKVSNRNNISNNNSFNYGPSYEQYEMSDIPAVHDAGISGEGIIIGILDTGFRWKTHPALKDRKVLAEYDFVNHDSVTANETNDSPSQDSHGTLVFSIIAGKDDGQIIGPAFNAEYLLAKTEDVKSETQIEEDNFAAALQWMEAKGVDIVTSSLGYNEFQSGTSYTYADMNGQTTIVAQAENMAFARGVVTVTAMGNEGGNPWRYMISPADAFDVISVGALDADSSVSSFSSIGPTSDGRTKPEIAARGESVYAAINEKDQYRRFSGTSVATPIVAGIIGQLLSYYPFLSNSQVRRIIIESGNSVLEPDNKHGYGLLSAIRAINFPNIHIINRQWILNKSFIDKNVDINSVKIFYKLNQFGFIENAVENQIDRFVFSFPQFSEEDSIQFYFSYGDMSGNEFREPEIKNYQFSYGSNDIYLNTGTDVLNTYSPRKNIIFPNFPNPFSTSTTIRYDTIEKQNVSIIIYNVLGEKVKNLFRGFSKKGMNFVQWNGRDNSGRLSASGIYIYVINISGQMFFGKLVYLK